MFRNLEVEKLRNVTPMYIACVLRGMKRDGQFPWSSQNV